MFYIVFFVIIDNMASQQNIVPKESRKGLVARADRLIGSQAVDKILANNAYQWAVDGLGNNLFSLVFALNEHYIAGLSITDTLKARATAFFGNMVVGRPYTWFRDQVFKKVGITEKSSIFKKAVTETLSFAVGQAPIYAGYLIAATAGYEAARDIVHGNYDAALDAFRHIDWKRIGAGATTLTIFSPLYGPGQGYVQDVVRHQCGLKSAAERTKKSIEDKI